MTFRGLAFVLVIVALACSQPEPEPAKSWGNWSQHTEFESDIYEELGNADARVVVLEPPQEFTFETDDIRGRRDLNLVAMCHLDKIAVMLEIRDDAEVTADGIPLMDEYGTSTMADTAEIGLFDWSDSENPNMAVFWRGSVGMGVEYRWTRDLVRTNKSGFVSAENSGGALLPHFHAQQVIRILRAAEQNDDPDRAFSVGITDAHHLTLGLWSDFNPDGPSGLDGALDYLDCEEG